MDKLQELIDNHIAMDTVRIPTLPFPLRTTDQHRRWNAFVDFQNSRLEGGEKMATWDYLGKGKTEWQFKIASDKDNKGDEK